MSPDANRSTEPLSIVSLVAGVGGLAALAIEALINRLHLQLAGLLWVEAGAIVLLGLIALITGIAARVAIRREHRRGVWFARLGILLGVVLVMVGAVLALFGSIFANFT